MAVLMEGVGVCFVVRWGCGQCIVLLEGVTGSFSGRIGCVHCCKGSRRETEAMLGSAVWLDKEEKMSERQQLN